MSGYIGKRIGHYSIRRQIGHGGFSNVYLADHVYLGTQAAIKILKRPLAHQWRRQFRREARLAAKLHHANILPVLDYGIFNGTPYLVMPYAPHGSLRREYPCGSSPAFDTMLDDLEQIASALDYLHDQGLLHLDLKPENLLIGDDGNILLGDFGIAEMARRQPLQGVGTPAYMAPEQIQGHACAASDQYALAILVYEWLVGRAPFEGTREEILDQQLYARPDSICAQADDVTPAMERVVFRALSKDPARRYPSVGAFVQALSRATFPERYAPSVTGEHTSVTAPGKTLTLQEYLLKSETWQEDSRFLVTCISVATVLGTFTYLVSKSIGIACFTFGFATLLLPLVSFIRDRNLLARWIIAAAFVASLTLSFVLQVIAAFPLVQLAILTTCIVIANLRKYVFPLWTNPGSGQRLRMWLDALRQLIL